MLRKLLCREYKDPVFLLIIYYLFIICVDTFVVAFDSLYIYHRPTLTLTMNNIRYLS